MTTPAKTKRVNKGFSDPGVVKAAERSDAFTKARNKLEKKPSFLLSCDFKYKEGLLAVVVNANRAKLRLVTALMCLVAVMVGSPPAQAEAPVNSLHTLCCSYHHNRNTENEFHAGLFYGRRLSENWSAVGGTFTNSTGERSWLLGTRYERPISENWDFGVTAGAVTGYSFPVGIVPELEYRDTVTIYVVPGHVYAVGFTIARW